MIESSLLNKDFCVTEVKSRLIYLLNVYKGINKLKKKTNLKNNKNLFLNFFENLQL